MVIIVVQGILTKLNIIHTEFRSTLCIDTQMIYFIIYKSRDYRFFFHLAFYNYFKPKQFSCLSFTLCIISPALPVDFKEPLKNVDVTEGDAAALRCELSKPNQSVEWKKGSDVLTSGDRVSISQVGSAAELIIQPVTIKDAGKYTCRCGDKMTTAVLTVNGKKKKKINNLIHVSYLFPVQKHFVCPDLHVPRG